MNFRNTFTNWGKSTYIRLPKWFKDQLEIDAEAGFAAEGVRENGRVVITITTPPPERQTASREA